MALSSRSFLVAALLVALPHHYLNGGLHDQYHQVRPRTLLHLKQPHHYLNGRHIHERLQRLQCTGFNSYTRVFIFIRAPSVLDSKCARTISDPSSPPDALNGTGQGCGYTSPSIGASAETLQSATIDFCRKNFRDDHDYAFKAHRDGGHDVRVLLTDGTTRSAMFRTRLVWEHVTSVNWISLNQAGCYGFFMAAIKPCADETGSLVFYGHLNTTIDEVPALFTVTVEPYESDIRPTN
ncbi:hypothetical protein CBER1_04190 [Cercospora berteroae]|uniref:Uncharacterized protein n=1 Tax=Cercospora berteroae TaxID=357750 RepID=A0A2S6CN39_9PEZI|nr:hypothetical protein CBER1_04190 [Cercospora berteroae]